MNQEAPLPVSLERFAQEDEIMKEFYQCYFVDKFVPDKNEIYTNARFFAVFSVQCRKRGVEGDIADKMANRLNCYIWMLKKLGYKSGQAFVRRKISGLDEMLGSIFHVVDTEE
jgi:hypothetical protein